MNDSPFCHILYCHAQKAEYFNSVSVEYLNYSPKYLFRSPSNALPCLASSRAIS